MKVGLWSSRFSGNASPARCVWAAIVSTR
jgi:hypothetical protein